ncbi:hypothetical protein G4B88_000959 [Cannabis sativa]|uniref:Uncharacterized protein n=1 Tax=Cannabis sativa TaxID=3483 RepID=A0A7J6F1X0_CANSA|nr:hypothetical protein G4B88_000959 [Cannabis sativa]
MEASDKDLEAQLVESGNRLAEPPSSVDELLTLLDRLESYLSKVEQSPSESMENALSSSLKALIDRKLLEHSDADVRVAVASCISEITRITAPDAPYSDDRMKEVFQLIVSSFEDLGDNSSRSYTKRISILETVAKVRSCVVMLDLECDSLILEMFRHFLKEIRDYHPETVLSSMETIMTLVLEESEDISLELLTSILSCVKIDNKEVLPISLKLGEKVFETCATKVKTHLVQAIKNLGTSLDDYSKVVATICQDAIGDVQQNDIQASDENMAFESRSAKPSLDNDSNEDRMGTTEATSLEQAVNSMERSPQPAMSNGGITLTAGDISLADPSSLNKQEEDQQIDSNKDLDASSNADPESLNTEKAVDTESPHSDNENQTAYNGKASPDNGKESADNKKKTGELPNQEDQIRDLPASLGEVEVPSAEAAIPSGVVKESDVTLLSPKALESEHANVASMSPSEKLPDESHTKKSGQQKKNISDKEAVASVDDVSKKVADMTNRRSGKKLPAAVSYENKDSAEVNVYKKGNATTSDSEVKSTRRSGKKVSAANSNVDKAVAVLNVYKKDSGTTSDSEAKPLSLSVKNVDGCGKKDVRSSVKHGDKKKRARGTALSEKDLKSTTTEVDSKDTLVLPKSSGKTTKDEQKLEKDDTLVLPKSSGKIAKDEQKLEETLKTNYKRKCTLSKANESGNKGYGEDWIGMKVRVWWPKDQVYYDGFIESFDPVKKKHKVLYNDGDEEILNLKREKWEFMESDSGSDDENEIDRSTPDASTEHPMKKKVKKGGEPFKQKKSESSSKRGEGASSKGTAKSGQSNKANGKLIDGPKSAGKLEDRGGKSNKDHTPKSGSSKSANVLSKSSTKSRNNSQTPKITKSKDESSTPSTKSKQEIQKAGKSKLGTAKRATVSKDQSGGKSAIDTAKVKSGSLKMKEVEDATKGSAFEPKPVESTKGKSLNTSKAQKSEVKTGKKRRRSMKG